MYKTSSAIVQGEALRGVEEARTREIIWTICAVYERVFKINIRIAQARISLASKRVY